MKLKPFELLLLVLIMAFVVIGCSNKNPFFNTEAKTAPKSLPKIERFKRVDCTVAKCVAITYDDGPDKYTMKYLKMLDVPATFFVVGNKVVQKPEIVKKASDQGHQICNHSWNHANLAKLSPKDVDDQITKTDAAITKVIGSKYKQCLRFPYGSVPRAFFKTHPNMLHIAWTNDSLDWRYKEPKTQYQKIFANPVPANGVILFHDVHQGGLTTSPKVITELKKQGFTFVTIDELNLPSGELNMDKEDMINKPKILTK